MPLHCDQDWKFNCHNGLFFQSAKLLKTPPDLKTTFPSKAKGQYSNVSLNSFFLNHLLQSSWLGWDVVWCNQLIWIPRWGSRAATGVSRKWPSSTSGNAEPAYSNWLCCWQETCPTLQLQPRYTESCSASRAVRETYDIVSLHSRAIAKSWLWI